MVGTLTEMIMIRYTGDEWWISLDQGKQRQFGSGFRLKHAGSTIVALQVNDSWAAFGYLNKTQNNCSILLLGT